MSDTPFTVTLTQNEENRIIAISAPALLPMLRRRQKQSLDAIYGAYRNGTTEFRNLIAEYVTLTDLITDIEVKLNQHHQGV